MPENIVRRRPQREPRPVRRPGAIRQPAWRQPEYRYPPVEIVSADAIEAIHAASLTILETMGMRILSPEAREILRDAGAALTPGSDIVRLDRGFVLEKVARAPESFTLRARNPARDLEVGGPHAIFSSVGGPAYAADLDRGRRSGTYAEMCDYIRLVQSLEILHQEGGGPFEALDLPQESRHLDLHYAQITLMDKNWQPWGLGRARARDGAGDGRDHVRRAARGTGGHSLPHRDHQHQLAAPARHPDGRGPDRDGAPRPTRRGHPPSPWQAPWRR